MDITPIIEKVQKFGAETILGILLFWVFYSYFPSVHAGYRDSIREAQVVNERQATAFLSAMSEERKSREDMMQRFLASNSKLEQTVTELKQAVNQLIITVSRNERASP